MSLPSFSEADLRSGTESPTKPGVYWFQSETMARALLVEVRVTNEELTKMVLFSVAIVLN